MTAENWCDAARSVVSVAVILQKASLYGGILYPGFQILYTVNKGQHALSLVSSAPVNAITITHHTGYSSSGTKSCR